MKKKIVEELHLLAEEVLRKDNTSGWEELQEKAKSLYERLTVQVFLSENDAEISEEKQNATSPEEDLTSAENDNPEETLAEPLIEKIKDIVAQMPSETQHIDEILDEILPKKSDASEIEAFASVYQQTPVFERKDAVEIPDEKMEEKEEEPETTPEETSDFSAQQTKTLNDFQRQKSLNDILNKNINIGLNDKLAFTKHLFNGNADDYHRVVSQVATLSNSEEVQEFIQNMVKPDYDWDGKEVYAERFIAIIEKRFG